MTMRKLVLLGGGYGCMQILRKILGSEIPDDVKIILIDKVPYHCFKTEFYALAAGTLSDNQVRMPFPKHHQLEFINDEVTKIDLHTETVHLKNQEPLHYDDLVIGLGSDDKYHDIPGAQDYTYGIQSIEATRKQISL